MAIGSPSQEIESSIFNDVEDPKIILVANMYWTDIAKCESVPVMEAEEASRLMSKA